jgi:hypothetical protein
MFDLRESEDIEIWCFSYLGFWIKLEEIRYCKREGVFLFLKNFILF